MIGEHRTLPWAFWLQWVLATAIGVALGFQVIARLGYAFVLLFAPAYALMGGVVGLLQWIVLRRKGLSLRGWIPATVAGFTLGGTMGFAAFWLASSLRVSSFLSAAASYFAFAVLMFAPIGPGLGIAQWLSLRRHIDQAGWWVLASTAALALFAVVTGVGFGSDVANAPGGLWALGAVGGLAVGAVTGSALVWLMRSGDGKTS